jgi:hypothetical protein
MCVCNDPARWLARCRQTTLASHISGMVGVEQTALADQEFEIETYTAHDIGAEIQLPTKILTTAINTTAVSPSTATLRWVARSAVNMDQFMAPSWSESNLPCQYIFRVGAGFLPRCCIAAIIGGMWKTGITRILSQHEHGDTLLIICRKGGSRRA